MAERRYRVVVTHPASHHATRAEAIQARDNYLAGAHDGPTSTNLGEQRVEAAIEYTEDGQHAAHIRWLPDGETGECQS
jgi:hypothetical protein